MCKNRFPITKQKLRSNNKICFDENDCNENLVFLWTYWDMARTNKTSESAHFIWRYIHETSKALYYVFEFKCSEVLRIKKPEIGPCLSYKILRIFLLKQQYPAWTLRPKIPIFTGGIHWILPKN